MFDGISPIPPATGDKTDQNGLCNLHDTDELRYPDADYTTAYKASKTKPDVIQVIAWCLVTGIVLFACFCVYQTLETREYLR